MNTSVTTASAPVTPARPGHPTIYSPAIVDLLCAIIRSNGSSDSGAAALAGVHPSTISRWKREHPDLVITLLQAREQFRDHHLSIIMRASEAKGGWRAAAWLLERIFPADYHPKAAERERFQKMQDKEYEEIEAAEADMQCEPNPVTQAGSPRRSSSTAEEGSAAEAGSSAAAATGNHFVPALHNSQNTASAEALLGLAATAGAAPQSLHQR